jgi:hypothetical protein
MNSFLDTEDVGIMFFRKSIDDYESARRYITENTTLHSNRRANFKSH